MEDNSNSRVISKPKERRLPHHQNEVEKKMTSKKQAKLNINNSSPQFIECNSPVKKVLFEANEIVKISLAKEFALFEKDATIQISNETIDNLRKNHLQLQMEYEKLDQNCQNEILCRVEILKRIETTRNIVESTAQFANTLSKSLKLLEDDKYKIAEYYEIIYNRQKEIESKYFEVMKFIKNSDDSVNKKFEEVKNFQEKTNTQSTEALSSVTKKLSYTNEKLNVISIEKEKLQCDVENYKITIKNLDVTLESKQSLLYFQEKSLKKLNVTVKKLKSKSYKLRKSLKCSKNQMLRLKLRFNELVKDLLATKTSYGDCLCFSETLKADNNKLKIEIENQFNSFQIKEKDWVIMKEKLLAELTEKEITNKQLINSNLVLNEKLIDFEKEKVEFQKKEENERLCHNEFQEKYMKLLNENDSLTETNEKLRQENIEKSQKLLDYGTKLNIFNQLNNDLKLTKTHHENEVQKYEIMVKGLEENVKNLEEKLSFEREKNENLIIKYNDNQNAINLCNQKNSLLEQQLQDNICKMKELNMEKEENSTIIQTLKNEVDNLKSTALQNGDILAKVKSDLQSMKEKNDDFDRSIKNEKLNCALLHEDLEKSKNEIFHLQSKLKTECTEKTALKTENTDLSNIISNLKKQNEFDKKRAEQLQQINVNLEKNLSEMNKVADENLSLKTSIKNLESRLDGAEARVEAFKIIIKKLETEKDQFTEKHLNEISKLQNELKLLQETTKKEKEFAKFLDTSQRSNEPSDKEFDLMLTKKNREKVRDSKLHKVDAKENDTNVAEVTKLHQGQTTPRQTNKKFLSTPRKILTSTPQHRLQNLTPQKNKRDPYEFDSDDSVERLDADNVLKVLNGRPNKERVKKAKTNF